MRLLADRKRDPFVQVPERGREAALTETADPRDECVVKRCEDTARREAFFFDAAELLVLLRDPRS
jgi:hypothetical protein